MRSPTCLILTCPRYLIYLVNLPVTRSLCNTHCTLGKNITRGEEEADVYFSEIKEGKGYK